MAIGNASLMLLINYYIICRDTYRFDSCCTNCCLHNIIAVLRKIECNTILFRAIIFNYMLIYYRFRYFQHGLSMRSMSQMGSVYSRRHSDVDATTLGDLSMTAGGSKTKIGIYKMVLVAVRKIKKSAISLSRDDLIHLKTVSLLRHIV